MSSLHHEMSHRDEKIILNSHSQQLERGSPSVHDPNFGQDGFSQGTHTIKAKQMRTIMEILHDRITEFVSRNDA
jgi:hypothetical protein